MSCTLPKTRIGFTLVELLVVIAIIGVLVALLLPAVQAARESARLTHCRNNLKQLGLAVTTHQDVRQVYPMGRDRTDQRSLSWAFRLLPFLELATLADRQLPGLLAHDARNAETMRTPIAVYTCPSRRPAQANRDFDNDDDPPVVRGAASGGDYGANAGYDYRTGTPNGIFSSRAEERTIGPIHSFSRIRVSQVLDGLSNTVAIGERHIASVSNRYPTLSDYRVGDTAFLSGDLPRTIMCGSQGGIARDVPTVDLDISQFGSVHPSGVLFVFLDGHVDHMTVDTPTVILDTLVTIAGDDL